MSSFDILDPTTSLQPRLFLEASAGTGKTFTIEHLLVRLLLETSLTINEIVIVTFTRAATRELKERIRLNLEQIIEQNVSFPYLENISDLQKSKIEDELRNFEKAQIFTIHGFCAQLLNHFAFEAGVGLRLSEWTREEESWEVKEFLREQTLLSPGQIRRLLGKFQFEMEALEKALLRSSEHRRASPSSDELFQEIQSQLPAPFPVAAEFEKVRSSYKGMTAEEFTLQAQEIEEVLARQHLSPKVWEKWITTSAFFLKNLHPGERKAKAQTAPSQQMTQLRDLIWPRLNVAQNPQHIFLRLSAAWHLHRQKISQQREKVTPDDLLKMVHAKLQEPSFLQAARQKYQAVIVDEFQDTDPLQWQIFKTLFLEDRTKSVYLVGDPKQSIYAFRQADIYTFLDAAKVFNLEQKASLVRNFRSSSGLLSKLNHLFCQAPWMDLPKHGDFLEIPQALAAHEGEGTLCFMIAQGKQGRSNRFPTSEIEEEQLFPFIAQEIEQKKLNLAETAILVKDRYQAQRMKLFLDRWKIPSILQRNAPLSDSPVVEFLQEAATACLELTSSAIKKLLLGPFACTPAQELTPQLVFEAKQHLINLKTLWMEEGFAPFFAQFLNTIFWKASALAQFYKFHDNILYDDLLQLIQKIALTPHPYQFKQTLDALKKYEVEDRISSHPQGIQIMTIHASKGLEFETVFALGLASRSPTADLSEDELKELDAEKMRQLYVALTRAEKRLYIPLVRELPAPSFTLGEGSPIELFLSKTQLDLSSFSQEILYNRLFHLQPYKKPSPPELIPPASFQPSFPPKFMHSFSSLAQESVPTLIPINDGGIEAGIQTGLIVHRILERYFNQDGDIKDLITQETKRTPLASKIDLLYPMLQNTLALPLENFCLNDISPEATQTEMEFLYSTEQGWMKGYIDLCFEHEGRVYAIDWKTNLLENTDPQTLKHLMHSHDYLLQGQIYTEALQRYLASFPHLSFGGVYFMFVRGPAVYHDQKKVVFKLEKKAR